MGTGADVVERYLQAIPNHDWDGLRSCLADEGFVRTGPFGDRAEGVDAYLGFLRDLIPTLEQYRLDVHRITPAGDHLAFAEISETMVVGDGPQTYPEVLVFELTGDGRIRTITIYVQQPGGSAVVAGGKAVAGGGS